MKQSQLLEVVLETADSESSSVNKESNSCNCSKSDCQPTQLTKFDIDSSDLNNELAFLESLSLEVEEDEQSAPLQTQLSPRRLGKQMKKLYKKSRKICSEA